MPETAETVEIAPAPAPTPEQAAEASEAVIAELLGEAASPAPATVDAVEERTDVLPISVAGLRESVVPVSRPTSLQLAAVEQAEAATPVAGPSEIDPEGLATGTRLVQLGAFDDEDGARAEWDRLAGSYPEFFVGRGRIVQSAVSGGREFYRLRAAGFDDLMDARRFCTALLADGAACIPVTVR